MSFKIKETKFSLLVNPPENTILLGIDSDDSKLKIKWPSGLVDVIQTVESGGGSYGESVIIGSTLAGAPTGQKFLANGRDVWPEGNYVQVSGINTRATGNYTHATGKYTITYGDYSFSGGVGRTAGVEVIASGEGSFNFSRTDLQVSNVLGKSSAILGGIDSNIKDSNYCAILGGNTNTISGSTTSSVILGGTGNKISSSASNVGILVGLNNVISGSTSYSTILGGTTNRIGVSASGVALVGGAQNVIGNSTLNSVIIGGINNQIGASINNTVVLGYVNIIATKSNAVYAPNVILKNTSTSAVNEQGAIVYDGTKFRGYLGGGWVDFVNATSTAVSNWNTAYSWGNHAGLYRPISYVTPPGGDNTTLQINSNGAFGGTNIMYSNDNAGYGLLRFRAAAAVNSLIIGEITQSRVYGIGMYNDAIIATYDGQNRYSYGNGIITVQESYHEGIYMSPSFVPNTTNIGSNYILTYDATYGGAIQRAKPTTLAGYGINEPSEIVASVFKSSKYATSFDNNITRNGKVYSMSLSFYTNGEDDEWYTIGVISPPHKMFSNTVIYFTLNSETVNNQEMGLAKLTKNINNNNIDVTILVGKHGHWAGNVTWFGE